VLQLCSPGDWEFITEYRRIANNMRRILFILSTLAVMGAVDVLKQAMKPAAIEHAFGSSHRDSGSRRAVEFNRTRLWRDRPVEEQYLLALNVLLYLGIFVASLICAVADVTINYKNNYESLPLDMRRIDDGNDDVFLEWQMYALDREYERSEFKPILDMFYRANIVRFVLALLAWVGVCLAHYLEEVGSDSAETLSDLDKQLFAEQEKNRRLASHTGTLQSLSMEDLSLLFHEQKRAVDMTQYVLQSLHQRVSAHQQGPPRSKFMSALGSASTQGFSTTRRDGGAP
jgi:hypothetical protein